MVLEIHGVASWMNDQRVALVLAELDVPYNHIPVDIGKMEHRSEEYLAKQPFGQVPYMVDGDLVLFETRVICRYIATRYKKPERVLYPDPGKDFEKWLRVEQAISIEMTDFDAHAAEYARHVIYPTIFQGREPDHAAGAVHLGNLAKRLDGYERILSKQRFLGGEELTIADLFHLPYGILIAEGEANPLTNSVRPSVARWWKELLSLQSTKSIWPAKE